MAERWNSRRSFGRTCRTMFDSGRVYKMENLKEKDRPTACDDGEGRQREPEMPLVGTERTPHNHHRPLRNDQNVRDRGFAGGTGPAYIPQCIMITG